MELERLAARLRPRTGWEALDLGFALGRRWFLPLWTLWLVQALPVAVLMGLLAQGRADLWIIALWWLKPLYEAPMVLWVGRALFGAEPARREIPALLRAAWRPRLLPWLLWRRLGLNRSFHLPIALLEGLGGRAAGRRRRDLADGNGTGAWLTLACYHFEAILWTGLLIGAYAMIPEGLPRLDLQSALWEAGSWPYWLSVLLYALAFSIMAPFYVCAGFALYLSRRTELEAWDIDLAFRGVAPAPATAVGPGARARRAGVVSALALTGVLAMGDAPAAEALPSAAAARELIAEVLADEAFGSTREMTYWAPIERDDPEEASAERQPRIGEWAGLIAETLKWTLMALAAAALVLLLRRVLMEWRPRVRLPRRGGRPAAVPLAPLAGEVGEDDLARAVRGHLDAGDQRAALALLYRAGLAELVRRGVEIPHGATEGECLDRARARLDTPALAPFAALVCDWRGLAYAERAPGVRAVETRLADLLLWMNPGASAAGETGGAGAT